jgi:hypothetical protein
MKSLVNGLERYSINFDIHNLSFRIEIYKTKKKLQMWSINDYYL